MENEIKFCQNGNSIFVQKLNSNTTYDKLDPGIYTVNYSDMTGYYLTIDKPKFNVPEKIFGPIELRSDRVIATYNDRDKSTGILLSGNKGSGKTLLSEIICNKMIDLGKPIIVVNAAYKDQGFYDIIENIGDCVLLFDEFAKKYSNQRDDNQQEKLLSLMDGTGSCKRLMILTENNKSLISEFIISRPGRVYYHWEYDKLDKETIMEYCEHHGVEEDIAKQIIEISNTCIEFSYDMLASLMEEYKRFSLEPLVTVKDLNIEQFGLSENKFKLVSMVDTNEEKEIKFEERIISKTSYDFYVECEDNNPRVSSNESEDFINDPIKPVTESDDSWNEYFSRRDLVVSSESKIVYKNSDGFLAIFEPYKENSSWKQYLV